MNIIKEKLHIDQIEIRKTLDNGIDFLLNPLKLEEIATLSSHLVLNTAERNFVLKSLNYPSEMKLVYRASENELNISKFHKICDNVPNTFTIIKTEH